MIDALTFTLLITEAICSPYVFKPKALNPDEGLFLYIGREMAKGKMLYRDVMTNKPPMAYLLTFAIYKLGFKRRAIEAARVINSAIICITSLAIYFLVAKLLNPQVGLLAAIIWGITITNPIWNTVCLMSDNLVSLFTILSLLSAIYYKNSLLTGTLFGLALVSKQNAIFNLSAFIPSFCTRTLQSTFTFLLGVGIPPLITFAYFQHLGVGSEMITLLKQKVRTGEFFQGGLKGGIPLIGKYIAVNSPFAPFFGLLGFLFTIGSAICNQHIGLEGIFMTWLIAVLFLQTIVAPPHPHSLSILLPPLSSLAAIFLFDVFTYYSTYNLSLKILITSIVMLLLIQNVRAYVSATKAYWRQESRDPLVSYILQNTSATEKIYVLFPKPHFYLYANRESASSYVFFDTSCLIYFPPHRFLNELFKDLSLNAKLLVIDWKFISSLRKWAEGVGKLEAIDNFLSGIKRSFSLKDRVGSYDVFIPEPQSRNNVK